MGEDAWGGQDGYRRKLLGGETGNLEDDGLVGGEGWRLTGVEKIMVLDWRRSEMVVNLSLNIIPNISW